MKSIAAKMARELARALLSATLVMSFMATGYVVASSVGSGVSAGGTLAQFAATTSAQFFGVISDETGTGAVVAASGSTLNNTTVTGTLTAATGLFSGPVSVTGALTAIGTFTDNTQIVSSGGNGACGSNFSAICGTAANTAGVCGVIGQGISSVSSAGVKGVGSGNGIGVWADNTGTGYALYVSDDTTSAAMPAIHVDPQDAQPTGAQVVGDMWVTTAGVLKIETVAGTPGTASTVANMGTLSTVAATGSTQADSVALGATAEFVTVTAADGTKGAQLPAGSGARRIRVMNQVIASVLKVYGNNSDNDTVNGGAADAAYSQAGGTSLIYATSDGTNWFTY